MPRAADKIFLKLAVSDGYLTEEDADDVWGELTRLEDEGEPTKARLLCVEFGFMDKKLARAIKHEVRAYLEQKAREESKAERRIAGFELQERISSGAMGTVYKARHLKLNKTVALKLLNPDFAGEECYVARFLQEARAAASLNHANIVQAYDVGQQGDVHFIAMEFVDGKTVKDLIKRRGCLDEQAAIEIVIQVLEALKHAHGNSLIHRDVKPANIMVTRDGQAKLLDLGLVRRTDVENGLTGEGKAIGTPYFMAPEQALDKGADYRADFYALGATLFNMVTGQKPYVASTPVAVMNMHLKAPIPSATEINPKISTGLSKIIAKMLGKRPVDRYQDHDNLINDLTLVLSGFMPELKKGSTPQGMDFIKPRTPSSPQRIGSKSRLRAAESGKKSSLHVALAAAAGLLVVGGLVLFGRGNSTQVVVAESTKPSTEAASTDGQDRERAAKSMYAELTAGASWERVDDLRAVAQQFPKTETGQKASREARKLRLALARQEVRSYESQSKSLDSKARGGELREALSGYQTLASQLRDEELKVAARTRAKELGRTIDRRVATLKKQARALQAKGQERVAARLLRDSAKLESKEGREETLARAVRLERKASKRSRRANRDAERASKSRRQEEEAKLALLPANLREHVKDGLVHDAYQVAMLTAKAIKSLELRKQADRHVAALRAAVNLNTLALRSFTKRKGQSVSLKRKKGSSVVGTLGDVEGGRVTIKLSSRAELSIALDDLAEAEVWKAAKRVKGAEKAYLTGVTAIKLYRGDNDAEAYLSRCQDAGVDLSAVANDLRKAEPKKAEPIHAMRKAGKARAKPKKAKRDKVKAAYERAVARNKAARKLIENREKLFSEADRIGYADEYLEPIYDFTEGRKFSKDWRRVSGRSYPTPPGQSQRYGLVLEGRNGRAEFVAPLQQDVHVKIRIVPQQIGRKFGRVAITLDGKKRLRISNELGRLVFRKRGRVKGSSGSSQIGTLRVNTSQTMELILKGKTLISKFNGSEVARTTFDEELGTYKLGLEWSHAALNLVSIEVMCKPTTEWIQKKLK